MCSLYKRGEKGRGKCILFYIYKEYNKTMGKVVKVAGKYAPLYIYRVYNKRA